MPRLGLGLGIDKLLILGSGEFSPDQINGLQMWFDASDPATLWQDQAGVTPAGNGNPVGRWSDKTNNLWFLTSPNGLATGNDTNRPTLVTNVINGLPVVRMNGTISFLRRISSISLTGDSLTVFFVGQRVAFAGANEALVSLSQGGFDDHSNPQGTVIGHSAPDPVDFSDSRDSAVLTAFTHPGNLTPFHYASVYDGVNQTGYLNGVAGAPVGSTGNFLIQRLLIGFRQNASSDSIGQPNNDDYGELLVYNRALTAPELALLFGYATTKWGV